MARNLAITLLLYACALHFIQAHQPVSQNCLTCICHAASDCDLNIGCNNGVCGFLQMTKAYWESAGRSVVSGSPDDSKAFETCAVDPVCASKTLQLYMNKYKKDCNNDGEVTCADYLALHHFGVGCEGDLSNETLEYYDELKM